MSVEGKERPKRMKESTEENHNWQAGKNITYMYSSVKYTFTITEKREKTLEKQCATLTADSCEMYCTQRSILEQREYTYTLTLIS